MASKAPSINRCFGNKANQKLLTDYHDHEWGIPVTNDNKLFELLILEGAQAGLSWETVLKKREGYRAVFCGFDPKAVAQMTDGELEEARQNKAIIRHRSKIYGALRNAVVFLSIQKEFASFNKYLWRYVCGQPVMNHWKNKAQVPVTSPESDALSKDLNKRGMSFVGSTIIYAYMQAAGLVNDHTTDCWRYGLQ